MAWGPKYRHEFCDRYDNPFRLDVLEEDYLGSIIDVDAGDAPITITYESKDDFKFSERRSSTATIVFVGSTQFELTDLWTADERKYRVELFKDDILDWRGYVVPNGFTQDFVGGKYYAQITASDGLATLDGMLFVEAEGDPTVEPQIPDTTYTGRWTFKDVASIILRKLELDFDLWIAVDVYNVLMDDGPDDDPLNQCNVNVNTYISDALRDDVPYWEEVGQAFDCGKVLDNLCRIWAAKIYQSEGAWKIKRVNSDADDTPPRYWRKYNALGIFLESEQVDENLIIPCNGPDPVLLDGATLSMDRVFKQTKVNYKFTYVRDGDSPLNMISNGNFDSWLGGGPGTFPNGWHPIPQNPIVVEQINIPVGPPIITTGIQVSESAENFKFLQQFLSTVSQGDNLTIRFWQRSTLNPEPGNGYFGLYSISVDPAGESNAGYFLVASGALKSDGTLPCQWVPEDNTVWYLTPSIRDVWNEITLDIPPCPISGEFIFRIAGLAMSEVFPFTTFDTYLGRLVNGQYSFGPAKVYGNVPISGGVGPRLQATGFFAGLIKNTSSEEVPDVKSYHSINRDGFYTDQVEPFEILNSDRESEHHISHIELVEDAGVDHIPPKWWNTIDDRYASGSIGVILAMSIQDQYGKPSRIIDGAIKSENIEFGSRIEFDGDPAINDIRFVVQRGSLNVKENIFNGTFVEISPSAIAPGGSDGGDNLDPNWQPTGAIRCIKDGGGLNTGQTEYQEIDVNDASPTAGQTRWVPGDEDLEMCPIGEPNHYYWGSEPAVYNTNNFLFFPFTESAEPGYLRVITVGNYSNTGGLFLYFLHRDNLGLISRIEGEFQGNTISDWQYLADVIIDGFTYRVLRMDYPTGIYQDLQMSFFFE